MDNLLNKYVKKSSNPHLNILLHNQYEMFLLELIKIKNPTNILDVGGGKGWSKIIQEFPNISYDVLDFKNSTNNPKINFIQGDITSKSLDIMNKYDIIFTKDTFEHILNPWDTTDNILNLLNEDGIFIFLAPFSWRYHASPFDTYRYSHTGAQYIFEHKNKLKKVFSGYIPFPSINGFWPNKKDFTIDSKPFQNNLETIYIGQKDSTYIFDTSSLDSDFSWNHTT
jgi:SAM-dependent methyltransferase